MKRTFTILLGLVICLNLTIAQDRYLDEVFTSVDTEKSGVINYTEFLAATME